MKKWNSQKTSLTLTVDHTANTSKTKVLFDNEYRHSIGT